VRSRRLSRRRRADVRPHSRRAALANPAAGTGRSEIFWGGCELEPSGPVSTNGS
jgi:hypothetical protein